MTKEEQTLFEIDRAIKVVFRLYPEKCLDLFFGKDRQVVFQGVEDPQINLPERRADKVWLVSEQGRDGALHIEAILEPKKSELANFYVKNALLEAVLKRPVITVLVYLEKGRYQTFPNTYERSVGLFKNAYIFACVLLWEYKDRILSGEFKEFAPLLSLLVDNPQPSILEKAKELIAQFPDEEKRELMGVAILVACRNFHDELVRQIFKEQLPMVKEISFVREWLEESEQKGKRSILLALVAKKFGTLTPELQEQINQMSGSKLDNLSLALFDLNNLNELQAWLENGQITASAN
jgi:hypothetical protein